MKFLIAKPMLFGPTEFNHMHRLMFLHAPAVDALIGDAAPEPENDDQLGRRLKVQAWFGAALKNAASKPWITYSNPLDDRDIEGFSTMLSETATSREPAEGPALIVWDTAPSMQGNWHAFAHYVNEGRRQSHDLSALAPLIKGGADALGLRSATISSIGGAAPALSLISLRVMAGDRAHRFHMTNDTGEWRSTMTVEAMERALKAGHFRGDLAFDPAIITPAHITPAMPAIADEVTRVLQQHVPSVPGGEPPVTWKF